MSVAQLLRGTLWRELFLSLASFAIPYPSLISFMVSVDIKKEKEKENGEKKLFQSSEINIAGRTYYNF